MGKKIALGKGFELELPESYNIMKEKAETDITKFSQINPRPINSGTFSKRTLK
jgi:hypothetical protein